MRFGDFIISNPKVKLNRGALLPCVMMVDLTPGSRQVSAEKMKEYKGGSVFEDGDTLFARITPCLENGKIAQYRGKPAFGSTEFLVFRGRDKISDSNFVYYLCLTDTIRKPAEKSMFGASGRQRADLSAILDIEISAPSLDEQKKIAAILSAYDDLIENNTRRIQILEEMAQAIYREWFVHFRYPGHEGVRMVESELGMIPEGWRIESLRYVVEINPSQIGRNNEPEIVHYIDIASVTLGRIENVVEYSYSDAPSRARRIVLHGDTIWSTVRPNRKSFALILNPISDLIVSTGFTVIRAKRAPYTFVYMVTTTDKFVDYLTNHATGSAYPAVNQQDFANAKVLLPPIELLSIFHNIVEPMFNLKNTLMTINENLRQQRDLLLPRLISGELAIPQRS